MVKKKQPAKVVEVEAALPEESGEGEAAVLDSNPAWLAEILPDEDVPRESVRPLLTRRRVRYRLYRLRAEAAEGKELPIVIPDGFKESFEAQKWFDGWANFSVTWDVGDPVRPESRGSGDPLEVVPRYISVKEEWEEVIEAHVKSDTLATRKRARARQMEEANGSEDNLRRDES